jgi:hypothetical protein
MAGKRKSDAQETGEAAAADPVRCPLCGRPVPVQGDDEAPAALNRHFETDCTWRHTSRSPARPAGGR